MAIEHFFFNILNLDALLFLNHDQSSSIIFFPFFSDFFSRNATVERLVEYVKSYNKIERRNWDPFLLQCEIVDHLERDVNVIYLCYSLLGCLSSPRDFCLVQCVHHDSHTGIYFVPVCSTTTPLCPAKYARCQLRGGYIIQKMESGIEVSFVYSGNVGGWLGWLPWAWFSDDFILQRLQCVEGLRLYLDGDGEDAGENQEEIPAESELMNSEVDFMEDSSSAGSSKKTSKEEKNVVNESKQGGNS